MTHFALPTIRGTIEQQLKQIVGYLTDQAEKLNYNLDNSTPEKIFEQAAEAVTASISDVDSEFHDNRYVALKSLIIKTADEVVKSGDVRSLTLNGDYLAKSEFGEYFEKATVNISGTAYGIEQLYNYSSGIRTDLDAYMTDTSHFIKCGYLDTTGSSPVFGIEVGLLAETFTVTDKNTGETTTIRNTTPHKIRITPGELSLFSNGYKAAWISEKAIYFPNANITGGTIDIASGTFKVDNKGAVTATSGLIGGWHIDSRRIYSNESSYEVALCNFNNNETESRVLYCRVGTDGDYTFKLLRNGFLYANNAELSGKITATSGAIGGWSITASRLYYPSAKGSDGTFGYGIGLAPQSSGCVFYAGYQSTSTSYSNSSDPTMKGTPWEKQDDWKDRTAFYVSNSGKLVAKNAVIYGDVYASGGSVGGWHIDSGHIYSNESNYEVALCNFSNNEAESRVLYCRVGTDGDYSFKLLRNGFLYANNVELYGKITATSGMIGGWNLGGTGFYPNDKVLYTQSSTYEVGLKGSSGSNDAAFYVKKRSDGEVVFAVQNNGCLTAKNAVIYGDIYASGGTIGGFDIKSYYIVTTSTTWGTDGSLLLCPPGTSTDYPKSIGGSALISGWTITSGSHFGVTKNGNLYAENAKIKGTIIATEGMIGGWYLGPTELYTNDKVIYTQSSTYEVGLKGSSGLNDAAFYVRKRSDGEVIFAVQNNGCLTAKNAVIYGDVYASGGKIAGWNIGESSLFGINAIYSIAGNYEIGIQGSNSDRNVAFYVKHKTQGDKFYVKNNGTLFASSADITGKITATSGSFTGSIYASGGTIGGFDINSYYVVTSSTTWGTDGSLLLCPPGTSTDYPKSIGGSDKRSGWVITAGSKFGVDKDGYVFCEGAMMSEACFSGDSYFGGSILLGGSVYCSYNTAFMWATYDVTHNVTDYATWASVGTVDNKTAFYIGVPEWTMRLNGKSVQLKDGTAVTSDARLKTEIQPFSEAYEKFFMMLSPKTYKYIEGTSDRTHFGFIAQEMETAILQSGLTTQDVAAFVSIASDRDGFEGYELSIRYSEIVSLNTYMIQKCLNKIKALEDEITFLKSERTA